MCNQEMEAKQHCSNIPMVHFDYSCSVGYKNVYMPIIIIYQAWKKIKYTSKNEVAILIACQGFETIDIILQIRDRTLCRVIVHNKN